jgi:hypothetical protein
MVLELNLTQGLDGEELADALGVKVDNAYQMTHRMKERLERSMSALLVVRAGRDQCADLDGVARKWDGNYDVLWRKRFARHVDRCQRCQTMRSRLPKAILSGVALSQAAQSAVLAAPMSIRERVLSEAPSIVATETGRAWSSDGFPKAPGQGRGLWRYFVGAFLALALVIGLSEAVGEGVIPIDVETTPDEPVPSTTVPLSGPSTTVPESTRPTTAAPGGSGGTDGDAPGASPTTTPGGRDTTSTVVGETPPGETPPRNDPGDPGDATPPTDGTPTPPAYDPKNPPTFYVPPTVVTNSSIPTIR